MKTVSLLMAQYDSLAVIPVERVCADFFAPLTLDKFLRKKLSLADEAEIVRRDARMLEHGCARLRRVIGPLAAESVRNYEAAKERQL